MGVITISASYAAGGSEIAPHLAQRLGLPFVDRAIPVSVAAKLGVPVETVESSGEGRANRFWSLMASMAVVPDYLGTAAGDYVHVPSERAMREHTEQELHRVAAQGGGIVLGRGAAIVLAGVPDVLHVRLDGPKEGRIRAAMHQHGITEDEARATCRTNDAAREGYVRHFYREDAAAAHLYDLVIDSVAFGWPVAEELVVTAARLRGVGTPEPA